MLSLCSRICGAFICSRICGAFDTMLLLDHDNTAQLGAYKGLMKLTDLSDSSWCFCEADMCSSQYTFIQSGLTF